MSSNSYSMKYLVFNYIKILTPLVVILVSLAWSYHNKMEFLDMIKNSSSFICASEKKGGFVMEVDKQKGWRLKDDYFVLSLNRIPIEQCKAK